MGILTRLFNLINMDGVLMAIALIISISIHEFGHAYAAHKLGDDTAKNAGRMTLNPIKHMDPIGLLFMVVFKFGWAKGVPINSMNFKNRKADTIVVSLAGVTLNFALAMLCSFLISKDFVYNYQWLPILLLELIWYNTMLGVFNLVPLPPLDGSKVVASLLPSKLEYYFYKYEKYFYFVLVLLVVTGGVNKIIGPIITTIIKGLLRI